MPTAIDKLAAYAITAKHLKPSQVYHRIRLALRQRVLHRWAAYRSWCQRRGTGEEPVRPLDFRFAHAKPFDVDAIDRGTFTFLNRQISLGQPLRWFPEGESRLWVFHLHSFDYAVTLSQQASRGDERSLRLLKRLIDDWIAACPPASPVAWHSYPASLRIVNWIKAYSLLTPTIEEDAEFARRMRRSLYAQVCFLTNHLEYDLLNNHLLENGRALLFAGHFFDDRRARFWREKGRAILEYGLEEHILADGGHNELSPMYHQIVLEIYQETAAVMKQRNEVLPPRLEKKIAAMQDWLRSVLHPDGTIPLLNDAAFQVAPDPADSLAGQVTSSAGMTVLPDSGLFCFRDVEKDHFLIFDSGPIGPDHQPGHGHCDALSYELSLAGQRMIVDSGVEQYHEDRRWRTYYRSTPAHNTVAVDGAEQSEIWGSFRVARRARPLETRWSDDGNRLSYVTSSHTGYLRLPGKVQHRRFLCWVDRRFWLVCDQIAGSGTHHIESFIHFHPQVVVSTDPKISPNLTAGAVERGEATLQIVPWMPKKPASAESGAQQVAGYHGCEDPIQGWYAPEFGRRFARTSWCISGRHQLPLWTGYLLWPETSAVSVASQLCQGESHSSDACRVVVRTGDCEYSLLFDRATVKLEIESARPEVATFQE